MQPFEKNPIDPFHVPATKMVGLLQKQKQTKNNEAFEEGSS